MKRVILGPTLLALVLSLAACNHTSAADGSATINWTLGGLTCSSVGLGDVEVEIWDRDLLVDVQTESCTLGETTFNDIPAGTYDVKVWAYPPAKVGEIQDRSHADATHEGSFAGLSVRSNQRSVLESGIDLVARKGAIYVRWRFQNAEMCRYNGVAEVSVYIRDDFGNVVASGTYDCTLDDYIDSLEDPEMIEQASRGVYMPALDVEPLTLSALGLNDDGRATYKAVAEFQLDHGEVRDISLVLAACYDSCL